MNPKSFAYQGVYRYLAALIGAVEAGLTLQLPSLRQLSRQLGVSMSTVQYAYSLLEAEGQVYAVERSGYYACGSAHKSRAEPDGDLLHRLRAHCQVPYLRSLSPDAPCHAPDNVVALLRHEREVLRHYPGLAESTAHPCGDLELRRTLAARHSASATRFWCADDVYLGADASTVLELLVDALELKGHAVLVTAPCTWQILRALQSAGVKVLELPLCARGRVDLVQLDHHLEVGEVKLMVLASGLSRPQGLSMPLADRKAIAGRLEARGVWLLENDLDGDSCVTDSSRLRERIDPQRLLVIASLRSVAGCEAPYAYLLSRHAHPALYKAFVKRGMELAPIRQKALARLLQGDHADARSRQARVGWQRALHELHRHVEYGLAKHLICHRPQGGTGLWAQCRYAVDMRRVWEGLERHQIAAAPGELFSLQGLFAQHLLLTCPASPQVDPAALCQSLASLLEEARLD
jgi:DNA-binding transcriptional MocR family regulator